MYSIRKRKIKVQKNTCEYKFFKRQFLGCDSAKKNIPLGVGLFSEGWVEASC
jgi:hypothetical protein